MPSSSSGQPGGREEPDGLISDILALLAKLTVQLESDEHENWRWLAQHSQNPQVVEALRDMTVTAMRVVDAIGRLEPVNGATVSAQSRIPKGTVSKLTRRLTARELIRTEARPNNRKEVLFLLTPLGRDLYQTHRAFDERMERGLRRFLRRYSDSELDLLVRMLREVTETSFLTLGLQDEPTAEP